MIKKNRKGFLLGSETLKIVIAVICIAFLIYLLIALYFSVTGAEKIKQAEASLKDVISKEVKEINNNGKYTEKAIHVPNPADWFIFSFVGEEKKPNLCTGQNCLCICEEVILDIFGLDWQIKRCDEKGSCMIIPNLKKFDRIKIEKNGVDVLIKKVNDEMEVSKNGP